MMSVFPLGIYCFFTLAGSNLIVYFLRSHYAQIPSLNTNPLPPHATKFTNGRWRMLRTEVAKNNSLRTNLPWSGNCGGATTRKTITGSGAVGTHNTPGAENSHLNSIFLFNLSAAQCHTMRKIFAFHAWSFRCFGS